MTKKLPALVPTTAYQELRLNLIAKGELALLQGWFKNKPVLHLISVERNEKGEILAILPLALMYDEKDLNDVILPDMVQQEGNDNASSSGL